MTVPVPVQRDERRIQLMLAREYMVGQRVQIAPHYDLWVRGARYGVVRRVYRRRGDTIMAAVKMDHPQVRRLARLPISDLTLA